MYCSLEYNISEQHDTFTLNYILWLEGDDVITIGHGDIYA